MKRYFILLISCLLGFFIQIFVIHTETINILAQHESINLFINYFLGIIWSFVIYKVCVFLLKYFKRQKSSSKLVHSKLSDTYLWKLITNMEQVSIPEIDIVKDDYFIYINGLTFCIKNIFELRNFFDIFIRECYGYKFSKKTIVLDIGANIGLASLFFANNSMVEKVFSYEPVKETYNRALFNFKHNKKLVNKIEIFNFGISNADEDTKIVINPDHLTAASTLSTDPKNNKQFSDENSSVYMEKISLVSINNILPDIYKNYPEHNILLKIDCEGSEYNIFKVLDLNAYQNITTIIVEWHGQDSIDIEEKLKDNGFEIFSIEKQKNELFGYIGIIYAVRPLTFYTDN